MSRQEERFHFSFQQRLRTRVQETTASLTYAQAQILARRETATKNKSMSYKQPATTKKFPCNLDFVSHKRL